MHTGLKISDTEYYLGNYEKGRYAWEIDKVAKLSRPIPAKGKLSLWDWEESAY